MPAITRKGLRKRNEILYKTAILLKKTKYDHLTVRDICKASKISVGTFYHYFGKKEKLAVEIFKLIDQYVENTLAPSLTSDDEVENIMNYCIGLVRYVCKMGVCFCQSMNSISLDPKIYSREAEHGRPVFTVLEKIILNGQKAGQVKSSFDANSLAETIILFLRGMNFDWARRGGEYDLERWVREITEQELTLLRTQSTPA